MRFFDWLLGECELGWAKTAFLSMIFGLPLFMLVTPPDNYEGGSTRFLVIALGYPLLVLARRLYWRWRDSQLSQLAAQRDPRFAAAMESVKRWQTRVWMYHHSDEQDVATSAATAPERIG